MGDFQVSERKGLGVLNKSSKDSKNVKVPAKVDGLSIKVIGKNAFKGSKNLVRVELPEGITTIEENAFGDCENLRDVILPKTIKTIHPGAFRGCGDLRPIYIPSTSFKFTHELFEDEGSNLSFKYPERIKHGEADWVSEIWSGYISLGTNYKNIIITGYDINYDSDYHEVKKSKEGFYYFLNDDGTVTIGHGDTPYDFKDKDVIIPTKIDGHTVKVIGTEAFSNVEFLSMVMPETVKIISAHAFYCSQFNYLQLPSSLDYLNNSVFGGAGGILSSFKIEGVGFSNYSNYIKMPLSIKEYDVSSLEKPHDYQFVFAKLPQYDINKEKSFVGEFFYDQKTYISYTLDDKKNVIILSAPKGGPQDVPEQIEGMKVTGWDIVLISNFNRTVTTVNEDFFKQHSEENDDGVSIDLDGVTFGELFASGLNNKKACDEIAVPDNVTKITSLFGETLTIDNDTKIVLPKKLEELSGINAYRKPFFVPKTVKKISNITGTFFIEEGSAIDKDKMKETYSVTIFDHIIGRGSNKEYEYVIVAKKSTKCAYLINYLGKNKMTIGESIDGYQIVGCSLSINKELDILTINNPHINDDTFSSDFKININEHVNTFALGGSKKIYDLKKKLDFTMYNVGGCIEILEGVEEIQDYNISGFVISFGGNDEEIEDEYKRTIRLPKSLKRVGHNSLKDMNICFIEAYENTLIEYDAINEGCLITRYDDNGNFSSGSSNSVNGGLSSEFVFEDDSPSIGGGLASTTSLGSATSATNPKETNPLIEAVLKEDLESAYSPMVSKGQEILNAGKLEDVLIEDDNASATCEGSNGEYYFVNINLDYKGKIEASCTCQSFKNGIAKGIPHSKNRCKHVYALLLYIKREYAGAKRTYANNQQINLNKPAPTATPIKSAVEPTPSPVPAPVQSPEVAAATARAEKRSKTNWISIISASATTALLLIISLFMMFSVKGDIAYYSVRDTEIVSKLQHTTINMSSYFNGFGIFSIIVAILGAIAIPFIAKSKNKKILYGMLGVSLFAMIGMFSYIGAEGNVLAFKFNFNVGPYHYQIDKIVITGPYGVGKVLCILAFISSLVGSGYSIKEALDK